MFRTLLDDREKCRDSIQKLMRIIIAQGATISTQLAGLKEKEEAIDQFEGRMHQLRMQESGRDYLLHTYLDQLPGGGGGGDTEARAGRGGRGRGREAASSQQQQQAPAPGGVQPAEVKQWTDALDSINRINGDLTSKVGADRASNQPSRSLHYILYLCRRKRF